ncbi:MAG: M50 family metallopeptidase [Anaerolineae bacterium]|nr:M50 family metallopeptidase [Anaerolineae bacterium]
MKSLNTNPTNLRRRALVMTALAMIVVYILWNIPALDWLLYPLHLFTTFIHEAGHSLAAIITGGRVEEFVVSLDSSGYARTAGGIRAIVIPAGYLGSAVFGSLLFYFTNRFPNLVKPLAFLLGGGMMVFTALFARPDETGLPLSLVLGVGFGALLMFLGAKVPGWITMLALNVLAVSTALGAFIDLQYLVTFIGATRGDTVNDAVAFSQSVTPLVPASLIAIIWAGMALLMFGISLYYGAWKPLRQEIDTAYNSIALR